MRGFLDFLLRRPFLVVGSGLEEPSLVAPRSGPGHSRGGGGQRFRQKQNQSHFQLVSLNGIVYVRGTNTGHQVASQRPQVQLFSKSHFFSVKLYPNLLLILENLTRSV